MSAVPAYDLKFDELNIALGYATIGGGETTAPSAAVAKAMSIKVVAPKAAAPKAAAPKAAKKVRNSSRILGIPGCSVL
jgi:Tfp pilus assembly protein FimV